MIRLFIFIILSFTIYKAKAWPSDLTIDSIEGGACWIYQDGDTENFSVASFNEGKSYKIFPAEFLELEKEIQKKFKENDISLGDEDLRYKTYLKCSYIGIKLYLNFYTQKRQVCIEVKPSGQIDKKMEIVDIRPNNEAPAGTCEGQVKGELIVNLKSKEIPKVKECAEDLVQNYSPDLSLITNGDNGVIRIKLSENYYFKEKEMKEKIVNEKVCGDLISEKNISYNDLNSISGSYYYLFER